MSRYLGISRSAAYRAVRSGAIPSLRIGHRIRIARSALLRLLDPEGGQAS
jgi:excisionase family DNA binding protein